MKRIVAINCSPRPFWNTGSLVREAAKGAEEAGAKVEIIDLYSLERFTGCISCFGCKRQGSLGRCVYKDGLGPVLGSIREADGLILGSPNYLGDLTAGFRALYERLIFQYISYKTETPSYAERKIPALLITTSNMPAEGYDRGGYSAMLERYRGTLSGFVGETRLLISGDTLQVNDYSPFGWSMFDPERKKKRRETVFPAELEAAKKLGAEMVSAPWQK